MVFIESSFIHSYISLIVTIRTASFWYGQNWLVFEKRSMIFLFIFFQLYGVTLTYIHVHVHVLNVPNFKTNVCAGGSFAQLLVVVHVWLLWRTSKIIIMHGILPPVQYALEFTQHRVCLAYTYLNYTIRSFKLKLHVVMPWYILFTILYVDVCDWIFTKTSYS